MPIYNYRCFVCNELIEKFSPINKIRKSIKCFCGAKMIRDWVADHQGGNVDSQMREYSINGSTGTRLYSASYLPNQLDEARRKHPNTDFVLHNGCYLPRIHNRTHKLKYLKEYGNYVELD